MMMLPLLAISVVKASLLAAVSNAETSFALTSWGTSCLTKTP